jgi:hypothetical protein
MALTLAPADDIADAVAIASRLADAEQRLRDALLAGAPTGSVSTRASQGHLVGDGGPGRLPAGGTGTRG